MTPEGFRKYLAPYLEQGVEFYAYYYPKGFGLVKTGEIPRSHREYDLCQKGKTLKHFRSYVACLEAAKAHEGSWVEPVTVQDKPRRLADGAIRRWKKGVERLRPLWGDQLITVEFDGRHTSIEGGFEL